MTNQELFEACMKQAEFYASRFDQRRSYQWKINIGLWGAILAAIATGKVQLSGPIVVVAIILYCFMWLRGLWVANARDKKAAFHYSDSAVRIMSGESTKFCSIDTNISAPQKFLGFLSDWSMQFETIVTIGLLILLLETSGAKLQGTPTKLELAQPIRIEVALPAGSATTGQNEGGNEAHNQPNSADAKSRAAD